MTKWNIVPAVLALGLFAAPAQAQVAFGPQLSWGSDSDLGIGARVEMPIGGMITDDAGSILSSMRFIGSGDYFFFDCSNSDDVDCSWIELNANVAVPLPLEGFSPYVGGGLNVAMVSVELDPDVCPVADCDDSNTEVGLNLLGGLGFPLASMNAFTEARIELGGGEQFVLSFGFLF